MSSNQTTGTTRLLARYVVGSDAARIPPAAKHEAKRSLLNWIGCAIGGSHHEAVSTALRVIAPLSGAPRATIVGRNDRLDVAHAALINTMSAFVLDFDDAHSGDRIVLHPSGPVGSAALGIGEQQKVTGGELLHAFLLGMEIECRIGNAVYSSDSVGWFPTSTVGAFGAAACAGRLLGLDEQQMTWALGIAAAQSAGLRATHGTMTKSFSPGRAASNGVLAALLAAADFTSAENALEAPGVGFADLMGDSDRLPSAVEGLGETFQVLRNTYKPFACAIGMHAAIDGCLQLRAAHALCADQIEKIELRVFPRVASASGIRQPRNGLEAKVSLTHSVAVALLHGAAGEQQYSDQAARDPAIARLRERVTAAADPQLGKEAAWVRITLSNGKTVEKHIEHAVGSLERPMSDRDLERKTAGLASGVLPDAQVAQLIDYCWELETLDSVAPFQQTLVPVRLAA